MQNMRLQLEKEPKNELFVVYGCASHYLNLVGQDIVNQVGAVIITNQGFDLKSFKSQLNLKFLVKLQISIQF